MTQPRAYTQTTTFTDHSTVSPADPHSGTDLDEEFVQLKENLDDLNTNIALLQRDDGKLLNTAVHKDAFDQDALAFIGATGSGFTARGDWATATAYVAGDLVTNNAATYLTITESHTSGDTFAGDLSTYWTLIANSAIETSSASINMHNGDGNETEFATTYTYENVGDIQVFVNGALQATNLYTISNNSGNNITFTTAPSSGTNNVIIWGATVVAEAAKAGALTYRDTTNNHKITAERWSDKVDGSVVDAESGTDSSEYSSKAYAVGGTGVTTTSGKGAAKEWATTTGGAVDTSEFSAKEYAQGSTATGGTSKEWATNAGSAEVHTGAGYSSKAYAQDDTNDIGSSKDWAMKSTAQVASTDYSSKEWATGTTATSAKTYATKVDGAVTGTDYSSMAWAVGGTGVTDTATRGSAKDWATKAEDGTVDGTNYSALHHAAKSAASASAAATSETNAATSAANAATSYDSFDDRYLGSKSSNPTEDNDGNALVTGALFYNSSTSTMMVYSGSEWIAATAAGQSSLNEYKFVTTSGQVSTKTYSGTDAGGSTLSYTQDSIIVFMNGVQLKDTTDYTATNGTSIVLVDAPAENDEINIVAFKSFTLSDMVSKSSGGTFAGAVTFSAGLTGTTVDATTDFTVGGLVITDNTITDDGTLVIASTTATSFSDGNITNVGSIALDSIVADGTSITLSSDTALSAGKDLETSTTGKIKQKGAFMQSSTHQALTLGY